MGLLFHQRGGPERRLATPGAIVDLVSIGAWCTERSEGGLLVISGVII